MKILVGTNGKLQELHGDILYYIICMLLAESLGILVHLEFNSTDFYMKAAKPLKLGQSERLISELFNNMICSWYNENKNE